MHCSMDVVTPHVAILGSVVYSGSNDNNSSELTTFFIIFWSVYLNILNACESTELFIHNQLRYFPFDSLLDDACILKTYSY